MLSVGGSSVVQCKVCLPFVRVAIQLENFLFAIYFIVLFFHFIFYSSSAAAAASSTFFSTFCPVSHFFFLLSCVGLVIVCSRLFVYV